ncbi:RNA polymerase sigma factor [Aeoliella sp.]|uniref:RNA polymerase sigma factor n=1 Tax=Aeoliella sp. TaxID=2795800 RepID=UPI003CCBA521
MCSSTTARVESCLVRLRLGEQPARDELIGLANDRLLRLAHQMIKSFPRVERWESADDVLQEALVRLHKSLEVVEVHDARHFFRLAAQKIRWQLLDLARRFGGQGGIDANHASHRPDVGASTGDVAPQPADLTHEPGRLGDWSEFHEAIERLPDAEREIVDLLWYDGLTQEEAAEAVGVNVRTVKRRWRAARLALHQILGESPLTG